MAFDACYKAYRLCCYPSASQRRGPGRLFGAWRVVCYWALSREFTGRPMRLYRVTTVRVEEARSSCWRVWMCGRWRAVVAEEGCVARRAMRRSGAPRRQMQCTARGANRQVIQLWRSQGVREHPGAQQRACGGRAKSWPGGTFQVGRKSLIRWRSLRDSNPCYSLERAMSWASRRRERWGGRARSAVL